MIIKDHSSFVDEKGEIPLVERVRGTLRYGSSWYSDIQAQETVISRMQSALDDEYTLLRNLSIPGLDVTIPIVLSGPPGIQVIYTSALKGIYQAKGEQWRVMNTNSRRFREAKPNLINRILLLTQALTRHLERNNFQNMLVEPVLIMTDPGIHVDTKNPAVRIVMVDALERYIASHAQTPGIISAENNLKIIDLLSSPPSMSGDVFSSEEDRRIQEAFTSQRAEPLPSRSRHLELPFLGLIRFSNRQWIVLAMLVLVNMVVLAGLIIMVLVYS
jgi:hypothetical protein